MCSLMSPASLRGLSYITYARRIANLILPIANWEWVICIEEGEMKLDAIKLGLATAIAFGFAWIICSLFVVMTPGGMMQMSGHMVHSDFEGMRWSLQWTGFFVGLATWSLFSGLFAWAIAAIYNRLLG